jgi:hypothetical protein
MSVVIEAGSLPPDSSPPVPTAPPDHRGSWMPTFGMITSRWMELRKRRGLMIALVVVTIGLPVIFLAIRLIAHAADPKSYGPAGGFGIYAGLCAGVLYVFGFIVAATLGCTAGSIDLSDGMFRHLVVTGRSRLALYLARIPAGLGIILPLVAVGFTIVCTVCCFAAPTQLNYDGVNVPAGMSLPQLENWAKTHAQEVICDFNFNFNRVGPTLACGPNGAIVKGQAVKGGGISIGGPGGPVKATKAEIDAFAAVMAKANYSSYSSNFLKPSDWLMIRTGGWIELEATIGFIVGLGLGSLLGQRTVAVVLMIVLEIILTPIFSRINLPHFINLQRAVVGLATAHLEPGGLPLAFGGGGGGGGGPPQASMLVHETRLTAVIVIIIWLVVWTAVGAWRMMTRDA